MNDAAHQLLAWRSGKGVDETHTCSRIVESNDSTLTPLARGEKRTETGIDVPAANAL